ncbi:MAG: serine hydrolase [Myxococcales bacterium]|nr:serine hydrolase [Myxococcales bacterium]
MSELRQVVDEVARAGDFSGVVRVDAGPEVLVSAAHGLADRTHGVPNSTHTRFATASGTKLLTALAVGRLIDEGKCALESRLLDLLEVELPGVSEDVTVRHLLSHTSGVYDYLDEEVIEDFDNFELPVAPHKLLTPTDYLPMLTAGPQKFAPGARFSYSNGGYVMLGLLIEQLAGSYHQYIQREVMGPAGMTDSGFFRFDELPPHTATGYRRVDGKWRSNVHVLPVIGGPDGGAFVTAADVTRLWRALLSSQLLSPGLTREFLTEAAHYRGHEHYGHGLWIDDDRTEPPILFITGSDAGVSFHSSCHGDDLIATIASNATDGAWSMARAVKDHLQAAYPREQRAFRV